MEPIWYLGPAGSLQALTCPDKGVKLNTIRYGGVHRALSGAATVDITGFKDEFEFEWSYATEEEVRALRAMHTRIVPGPFWLINPLRKNRLSLRASQLFYLARSFPGVWVFDGAGIEYAHDWPEDAGLGGRCVRWHSKPSSPTVLTFDYAKWVPVLPGEELTVSVYMKGSGSHVPQITWMDKTGTPVGSPVVGTGTVSSSWARHELTATAPAGAALMRFDVLSQSSTADVYVAAPQIEANSEATYWEPGGGSVWVHLDQLDTSSPRFPLFDVSMTLLEA